MGHFTLPYLTGSSLAHQRRAQVSATAAFIQPRVSVKTEVVHHAVKHSPSQSPKATVRRSTPSVETSG